MGSLKTQISQKIQKTQKSRRKKKTFAKGSAGAHWTRVQNFRVLYIKKGVDFGLWRNLGLYAWTSLHTYIPGIHVAAATKEHTVLFCVFFEYVGFLPLPLRVGWGFQEPKLHVLQRSYCSFWTQLDTESHACFLHVVASKAAFTQNFTISWYYYRIDLERSSRTSGTCITSVHSVVLWRRSSDSGRSVNADLHLYMQSFHRIPCSIE